MGMNLNTARCPCGAIVQLPNIKARASSAKCDACISRARAQAHPGVRDLAMFEVKEHMKRSESATLASWKPGQPAPLRGADYVSPKPIGEILRDAVYRMRGAQLPPGRFEYTPRLVPPLNPAIMGDSPKPYSPPPSVWAGVRVSMAGDSVTLSPPSGCTLQFGYDHDRCTDRVKLSAYDCGRLVGETRVDCRLLRRTTYPGYLLAEEPRKAFSDLRYSKSELGFEEPAGLEDDE
jgi:hypothetical protein